MNGDIEFPSIMQIMADSPKLNNHDKITEALLRHGASIGMTLEQCSSPKYMNRAVVTLKRHVRRIGNLTFPDYTPRKLKAKKERKRGKKGA